MLIPIRTSTGQYPIHIEAGGLSRVASVFPLDRKALIVTDDGVPAEYAAFVAAQVKNPVVVTVGQGEASKSVEVWRQLLQKMLDSGFDRHDCVLAVGGGVVGDLAGFAAATYMRGIDFYNVPTTVLSQVDSSIGGKTAINFGGVKNTVGAFYPPAGVLVDPDLLFTLPHRQVANGLAEAIKMALCFDAELFEMIEKKNPEYFLSTVVERSLLIKKRVVEADEKETGLRRALNFGHTIGHGIESVSPDLYHGECVALGMIPMCSPDVRVRLLPVLEKLGLPTRRAFDTGRVLDAIRHDKKSGPSGVTGITVRKVGEFGFREYSLPELGKILNDFAGGKLS